jgi:hypothetical protein
MTSLAFAAPLKLTPGQLDSIAAGKRATESGQGNLENDNANAGPNAGTAEVSGPPGQINQGNTDCNNCTVDLPGRNR